MIRPRGGEGNLFIRSITYEQELLSSLTEYLSAFKTLNIEPPIVLFLTLLGVKGYSMGIDTWKYPIDKVYPIDRDILLLPEVMIDNYDDSAEKMLKPCFDSIWNACGFAGDFYYNDEEKWDPKG
ncbi:hypothetical protein ES708_19060 [subsurface metagenome]